MTKFLVLLLEAARICLYLRFMHLCVGEYRGRRGTTAAAFFTLWTVEGFLGSMSLSWRETRLTDLFFFMAEPPALFLLSFCFKGKIAGRLGTVLFLPTLYWGLKWTVMAVSFQGQEVTGCRYFGATAAAVLFLFLMTVFLGKVRKSRREREQERLQAELYMYERQFELIQSSRQSARALKHDLKHHVRMLSDMIAAGEREDALAYLSSMEKFMKPEEEYVDSGNEKIDSILNYMISRAKAMHVSVDWKVCIPAKLPVLPFDINVILSNLLENALQAISEAEQPVLSIWFTYDRNVLCIRIRNGCSFRGRIPEQREGHGFGLANVRTIAARYHGSLTISKEDGWFQADVLLFLP